MNPKKNFSYSDYIHYHSDENIKKNMLRDYPALFQGCSNVIDLGCGLGIFLDLLKEKNIASTGVDNDPTLVNELKDRGYQAILGDAISVWQSIDFQFDGLFCAHLIEHLSFDLVVQMIEGFSAKISPKGIVVMVFPNPESVEMQLFQFWRDPQHVRFYQADLICSVLKHYGFIIESSDSKGTWGNKVSYEKYAGEKFIQALKRFPPAHRLGHFIKRALGISALEVEAMYMQRLRMIGRECVIVARMEE